MNICVKDWMGSISPLTSIGLSLPHPINYKIMRVITRGMQSASHPFFLHFRKVTHSFLIVIPLVSQKQRLEMNRPFSNSLLTTFNIFGKIYVCFQPMLYLLLLTRLYTTLSNTADNSTRCVDDKNRTITQDIQTAYRRQPAIKDMQDYQER